MIISDNGIQREMTEEEIEFFESLKEQLDNEAPTLEEQLSELKNNQLDLAEAIAFIYESQAV